MSEDDDLTAWLRVQVEARLKLAREACHGTDGHWWRHATDWGRGGPPEPAGPLYGGERYVDEDGDGMGGEITVVYDEGRPTPQQFDHMEANDPRDVIARCEIELAILDEHTPVPEVTTEPVRHWGKCRACWTEGRGPYGEDGPPDDSPCRTIRLIGRGYRHRDGYRDEEWKP